MAAMLLYGCSDDSYKGVQDDLISSDEQVPVMIAVGDPSGGVVKGDGPVDNVKDLMDDDIYVYAFNRSANTSFSTLRSQSSLDCLVDASTDASRSLSGRRARLKTSDVYMTWVDESRTIYWPAGPETITAFDFYAYYFENVKPKKQVQAEEKKKGWVCKICGYVYEGEELRADFVCPLCKHGADDFERL